MKNFVFLKQLTKSDNILKTIYNSLWMMSDKLIMMFVSLFVSVLVARYLGPKNFGLINYSLSIISVFSALTSLGLESFIIKGFVDKDNPDGTIIGTGFLMQFVTSIISILSIYLIVHFHHQVTIYYISFLLYNHFTYCFKHPNYLIVELNPS